MTNSLDLTDYTLLDSYGLERKTIEGKYSEDKLVELFVSEWLPWYDCYDVCSRADYCKFPRLNNSGFAEIPCGVVISAMRNFVHVTFNEIKNLNLTRVQIQGYLDGAYYLTIFLFESELYTGRAMDAKYINSLREWGATFFGGLTALRIHLDRLSATLANIPEFQSCKGVVLVEGESEKVFIETLKRSHIFSFLHLIVETYQGKPNRGPSKLRLLIRRYISQGYVPYIQGDADGGSINVFDALLQTTLNVKKENTFVFEYDFETAIPKQIIYKALNTMGYLKNVPLKEFISITENSEGNVIEQIRNVFDIDLENKKVILAQTVANILNHSPTWNKNEKFMQSELGKFLLFLRKVK